MNNILGLLLLTPLIWLFWTMVSGVLLFRYNLKKHKLAAQLTGVEKYTDIYIKENIRVWMGLGLFLTLATWGVLIMGGITK